MKSLILAFMLATVASAQEIRLWPGGAPGSEGKTAPESVTETNGVRRVASIHNPSITPHLPPKETATGAAVIILPGGGHRYLSIDNEGHAAAKWLAGRGIAAFVLKYRLAREEGSPYRMEVHALQDAHRAVRLVRNRAREWNVDPNRVGLLGFSAGGQLAALAAARFDPGAAASDDPVERESSRPAFQALIYPGGLAADVQVPNGPPAAFLLVAFDDESHARPVIDIYQRIRQAGGNAEVHIYSQGGHGFGMRDRPLPVSSWPVRLHDWLAGQGFLKSSSSLPLS